MKTNLSILTSRSSYFMVTFLGTRKIPGITTTYQGPIPDIHWVPPGHCRRPCPLRFAAPRWWRAPRCRWRCPPGLRRHPGSSPPLEKCCEKVGKSSYPRDSHAFRSLIWEYNGIYTLEKMKAPRVALSFSPESGWSRVQTKTSRKTALHPFLSLNSLGWTSRLMATSKHSWDIMGYDGIWWDMYHLHIRIIRPSPERPSISISKHKRTASARRRSLLLICASASPAQAQFSVTALSAMARPARRRKAFFRPCLGSGKGRWKNIEMSCKNGKRWITPGESRGQRKFLAQGSIFSPAIFAALPGNTPSRPQFFA